MSIDPLMSVLSTIFFPRTNQKRDTSYEVFRNSEGRDSEVHGSGLPSSVSNTRHVK